MTRHLFRRFSVLGLLSFAVVSVAQLPPTGQRATSKDPAAPNPFVGAWAHTEAATENSSAMVAFLAIKDEAGRHVSSEHVELVVP